MPDYLANASCKGRRPRHLASRRWYPRPNLIAKLLRERHVARFLVAPEGFGKSALALEYADTVFCFDHVFWIDAKSPCFLRDLDRGILASTLLASDEEPFLVVMEDVPPLDSDRVEQLSGEMDRMLERGCEVLVTCVPTCDAFDCHRDRIKLNALDLLLVDEEVDIARTASERDENPAARMARSCRIAGLVWGSPAERASFLTRALREELPGDVLLLAFVILALQRGSLVDLAAFAARDDDSVKLLAEQYPYLGIDLRRDRFDAAPFSFDEVVAAFADRFDVLAQCSLFSERDMLAVRVADALTACGRPERACDAVRALVSRERRALWLSERAGDLLESACLIPACEVYRSLRGEKASEGWELDTGEACRRAFLGDKRSACAAARRVAGKPAAPAAQRTVAALVLSCCLEGDDRRRATRLASACAEVLEAEPAEGTSPTSAQRSSLVAAVAVRCALDASCARGAEAWLSWYDRGARGFAVAQSAAWVLRSAERSISAREPSREGLNARPESVDRVAAIVRARVSRSERASLRLCDVLAAAAFERACERGAVSARPLDPKTSLAVRRVELSLYAQRNACERLERDRTDRRRAFAETHPDVFRADAVQLGTVALADIKPVLTVNLFGGLDVRIGEERIDHTRFRRQKVKTLLALLVLNRGREFSRDRLVGLLWPDSDLETARKNFYSIWSLLRRALMTSPGACPYLIRQQNGLRLDAGLLASDITQLEEVCRILLFERPGYGGWANIFAQINDQFSNELLPSEDDNEAIVGWREHYRTQLVDALTTASSRLVRAGEIQEGLWFARAAFQRDRTREDTYVALMHAQIAAGQRTAALETYFSCRRFLTNDLGIDPSAETMRLYHGIIETEEVLG